MKAEDLRALQAPLKDRYRADPASAKITLRAAGLLDGDTLVCRVPSMLGEIPGGLHPSTGGDGSEACAGEMLLQSLVACAGVTLRAVATAMNIPMRSGRVSAEGDFDVAATLGVRKDVPVGFTAIRLTFEVDADATDDQIANLLRLTERYCVVHATLKTPPTLESKIERVGDRG